MANKFLLEAGGEMDLESLQHRFKTEPYNAYLGLVLEHLARGNAKIRWRIRREHCNSNSVAMGGFTAALLDTVGAYAAMSLVSEDQVVATRDMHVSYLSPIVQEHVLIYGVTLRCQLSYVGGKEEIEVDAHAVTPLDKVCAEYKAVFVVLSSEQMRKVLQKSKSAYC